MAAACEASAAHLALAQLSKETDAERTVHRAQALELSRSAVALYQQFGFVQIVECSAQEILFRHSRALAANGQAAESEVYLERAYQEMMRKHDMIPAESPYRKSYLENIHLHRDIRAAYLVRDTDSHLA
jgi:hypothetical protein